MSIGGGHALFYFFRVVFAFMPCVWMVGVTTDEANSRLRPASWVVPTLYWISHFTDGFILWSFWDEEPQLDRMRPDETWVNKFSILLVTMASVCAPLLISFGLGVGSLVISSLSKFVTIYRPALITMNSIALVISFFYFIAVLVTYLENLLPETVDGDANASETHSLLLEHNQDSTTEEPFLERGPFLSDREDEEAGALSAAYRGHLARLDLSPEGSLLISTEDMEDYQTSYESVRSGSKGKATGTANFAATLQSALDIDDQDSEEDTSATYEMERSRHMDRLREDETTIESTSKLQSTKRAPPRRATTSSPFAKGKEPSSFPEYDFLALITCITHLYKKEGSVGMQPRNLLASAASNQDKFTQLTIFDTIKHGNEESKVMLKLPSRKLFHRSGEVRNAKAARAFLSELRVLSNTYIRRHDHIIDLLGINWDCTLADHPQPMLVLQHSGVTLDQFQQSSSDNAHGFPTRRRMATEIAQALAAIHRCGVIHGDIRLENILVFENHGQPKAKIGNFSNCALDTGDEIRLPGKKGYYTAPEADQPASASLLKQTDVYSYGLVFAAFVLDLDIARNLGIPEHSLEKDKQDNAVLDTMVAMAFEVDQFDGSRSQSLRSKLTTQVLELTLQRDPRRRDLQQVLVLLSGVSLPTDSCEREIVLNQYPQDTVAIPYVALETVSSVVKDQIVRALQQVAECHGDRRQAAACFHLGVCFASNFGVNSNGIVDDARNGSLATQWLGKSAELGDTWGRLAILPVSRALEQRIDDKLPLVQWLHEIAVQGSGIALSQLAKVDKPLYETALRKNRSEFSGNGTNVFANISETSLEPWEPLNDRGDNVLHYAASVGNNNVLASILEQSLLPIDAINFQGDTALICAVRGGHSDTIKLLVDAGASAEISNEYSENPLHFLCQIEDAKVVELGMILLYAGAEMATVAVASSHHWGEFDRLSAVGGGTPLQRAVVFNSPQVLKALFEMEQILVAQGRSRLLPSWTDILTLLECAIKMHHVNLFDTLQDMLRAHLEWDFYPQTLDEVLKSWKVHRLPEVMEWCLRGNVFSNPETGLNWPEKFCRMMMFGSNHCTVLHKALRFLEDSGGSFLEQGCGDDSNAMAFAIRYGRRDSITWMLSKMKGASSDLFWGTVPLEKFFKTSHYPEKMMPWNSPEPQRFVARASSRHPDVPITNHRAKSFLVAVVCFAISHDQREILHDLLNHKDGFALDEGISTQIALAGYDDYHGGKSYTINTSEGPDYTLDAYGLGDARYLFPQPAGNYAVVFPVPKKRRFEGPGFTVMEATLNYSLLYVTLISTSEGRDISLALILLNASKIRNPDENTIWTPQHWFEAICLSRSGAQAMFSPLFYATKSHWTEMMRLLMQNGATPQDEYFSFSKMGSEGDGKFTVKSVTVLAHLLEDPQNFRAVENVLSLATTGNVESIVKVEDFIAPILRGENSCNSISWSSSGMLQWDAARNQELGRMELWQAMTRANEAQKHRIDANKQRNMALAVAAMQQNYWAINALLDLKLHPDGGGHSHVLIEMGRRLVGKASRIEDFYIRPLDVVHWTSSIANERCTSSGINLKHRNRAIAELLRSRGATRGREYSLEYQVLVRPLIWYTLSTMMLSCVAAVAGLLFFTTWLTLARLWRALVETARRRSDAEGMIGVIVFISTFPLSGWGIIIFALFSHLEVFSYGRFLEEIRPAGLDRRETAYEDAPLKSVIPAFAFGIFILSLLIGAGFIIGDFRMSGLIILMNLLLNLGFAMTSVVLFGFLTCAPGGRPAAHVGKLAKRIHGGNQEAAWGAMYSPRKGWFAAWILRRHSRRYAIAEDEDSITLGRTNSGPSPHSEELDLEDREEQERIENAAREERKRKREERRKAIARQQERLRAAWKNGKKAWHWMFDHILRPTFIYTVIKPLEWTIRFAQAQANFSARQTMGRRGNISL